MVSAFIANELIIVQLHEYNTISKQQHNKTTEREKSLLQFHLLNAFEYLLLIRIIII